MGLKSIFREIKRAFTFWTPIDTLPKWVERALLNKEMKLKKIPYGRWHFIGKNNIYRVEIVPFEQGYPKYYSYVKKRIRW